jgi:thiosulfate/3-mercaptopyruvate sulfurtransferase
MIVDYVPDLLAEPEWLAAQVAADNLVIVDCAFDSSEYARAHIPGARIRPGHCYVKTIGEDGEPGLFLPSPEEFAKLSQDLGIGPDTTIVAYDSWGSHFAARLWWVFAAYGHHNVRVLNGGWQAWVLGKHPISFESAPETTGPGLEATLQTGRITSMDLLQQNYANPEWQILDTRSDAEFNGTSDRGNARTGHIPGAIHLEWNQVLTHSREAEAVRRFLPASEMVKRFEAAGLQRDRPTVTYCQAAVRAAFGAFALEMAGFGKARVYDGSMAEWANRDDTPLE